MVAPQLEPSMSPALGGPHDLYGLVGTVVDGRFRVLGLHHAGPRGLLYEVEPPSVGYTRRALKLVTVPEAREPAARERLRAFVAAARGLEHPSLARLYDAGVLLDETPYLLTEWCPLPSLESVLEAHGGLPADVALHVLAQVAEAVAVLHGRGLCHGDVRPAHVLTDADATGVRLLKVVDAGLAPSLDVEPAGGPTGGVAFQGPELGPGRSVTPAADVYALGVLGYLLLTGRLPYRPDDRRATPAGRDPIERVRWLHRNESPVRPSRLVPDAGLPPAVENVIGRALAKSPARRHPNAAAFAAALDVARQAPRDQWPSPRICVPADPTPPPVEVPRVPTPVPAAHAPLPLWTWAAAGAVLGAAGSLVAF